MSMDQNTEKTKTLAGLAAEALDSETLMADTGSVPVHVLLDKAPRVSQVDHQLNVNGNVDTGATTGPVVVTGNKSSGDGISLLVEVHRSLENVDGSLKECSSKRNGEENGAEQAETEMVDAVDGGKDVGRSGTVQGSQGTEEEQGSGLFFEGMNVEENGTEKMENEMVDGGTEDDNSGEDARSVKHVYTVGDFVWGKIKSHPWWPGRIYDASCASDFALKFSQTGRLLVVYFGDGSFSWCPPAQLVPFADNFEKMSKQSASKSFLYAVEKALDEISVLVEFGMTCQCISEESRGLSWPLAVNAGIKKGVRVPEGETVRLLLSQYEPAGILKVLKDYAQTNSNSNILEFAVLKSWLSAFYRATCGCPLALYCEPQQVEGLEDKKDQVVDANDFSVPIEVPILGPSEEETPKSVPAKGPLTACDKISHKRKQKSVAELMEDSSPSPVELSEKKRRRKSGEQAKGHTSSSKSVDEKVGKRLGNKSGDTDLAKTKKLSVSIPERDEVGDQQDTNGGPLSRERKKSKYLSPPYMSPTLTAGKPNLKRELEAESQKISEITRIGERMANAARHILSSPATNGNEAVKKKKAERFDMTFDTMDIDSSVDEVLSEVQSTAVNPLFSKKRSLEKTRGFISTFRNSVYLDGSNYKQYHKVKIGKKRKSRPSGQGTEDEEAGTETSPVILMVTFSAGFSLPSDDEVTQIYNKFGDLNEKETKVLHDSNSVQVVYMRGSDAEEAFQESVKQSPFGAAEANFRLIYPSNPEIPLSSLRSAKGKSQVQLIKQKLKGMSSILEKCNGKITTEEKAELEDEIKGLLEKVSAVTSTNP